MACNENRYWTLIAHENKRTKLPNPDNHENIDKE